MHMLGKIVGIMEMDNTLVMSLHHIIRQQHTHGKILGNLACHIVALYWVNGGVLIGILLLNILIVALNKREDLVISCVLLALEALNVTIDDVLASNLKTTQCHDFILNHVLNLFYRNGMSSCFTTILNVLGGIYDLTLCQTLIKRHFFVGSTNSIWNLREIKAHFGTIAFNDLHRIIPLLVKDVLHLIRSETHDI